ncbi:hypothetical protein [Klebsiella quasipneumoniae]|nr:hypothetical protein [Klebsiella quasipneumoniae]
MATISIAKVIMVILPLFLFSITQAKRGEIIAIIKKILIIQK